MFHPPVDVAAQYLTIQTVSRRTDVFLVPQLEHDKAQEGACVVLATGHVFRDRSSDGATRGRPSSRCRSWYGTSIKTRNGSCMRMQLLVMVIPPSGQHRPWSWSCQDIGASRFCGQFSASNATPCEVAVATDYPCAGPASMAPRSELSARSM